MTIAIAFEIAIIFVWVIFLACQVADLLDKSEPVQITTKWHRSNSKVVNYRYTPKKTTKMAFIVSLILFLIFLVFVVMTNI